ncbi:hypothetical protein F511_18019 [Dorcoceras hygrometricum]|uniref:Uncharacterized protein n=1 Tax=Dorcoceras hygrometricum TaxID=472368 RepID=A0A2Z7APV2_9LAMI|nr:hypothetical protein F511_18019 [Dorcoceras hygrometricum]
MVTKSSKQAKGFAAQICALPKGAPNLTLGGAKTFPPLKILTVKTVGTYVSKNKSINTEKVTDETPVEKVVKKAVAKRRPAPATDPIAKWKRTTVGRAAPTERNLAIVLVATEAEPISIIPTERPSAQRRQAPKRKLIFQRVSDDEKSDEEETFEQGTDKERLDLEQPTMEETVEEIVAKVIAETAEIVEEEPALETVVTKSRIDVSAITNYDVVTSFKVLSNEEGPLVETEKRRKHIRRLLRNWAEICVHIVQYSLFGHILPVGTYNLCRDVVAAGPVVDLDTVPTGIFHAFQHSLEVEGFYDFFVHPVVQYISSSSSSESSVSIRPRYLDAIPSGSYSSASRIYFTEDIPHTSMPIVVVPFAELTDYFAQLQASVVQIQLEKVRTRDDVAELKPALSSKITDLEAAFAHASTYLERVFRNQIYDFQQEIKTQKATLSRDLDGFRKETHEGITTLNAQLSEIIAYINRGRDDKKGEIESSRGPPPDDLSRPGEGGSRSEPP